MIFENVEEFLAQKAQNIVKILIESYDEVDFDDDRLNIEREISETSLNYAKIYFFETKSFLSVELREDFKSTIRESFHVKGKEVEKMNDVDLLAYCIKNQVVRGLADRGIILL